MTQSKFELPGKFSNTLQSLVYTMVNIPDERNKHVDLLAKLSKEYVDAVLHSKSSRDLWETLAMIERAFVIINGARDQYGLDINENMFGAENLLLLTTKTMDDGSLSIFTFLAAANVLQDNVYGSWTRSDTERQEYFINDFKSELRERLLAMDSNCTTSSILEEYIGSRVFAQPVH